MEILQLCLKPPLPAIDGGCIAMHNITSGLLNSGHKVKILTAFTHKHELKRKELPREYLDNTELEGVYIDTRVNLVDAFSSMITQDSYNVSRFFNPDFDLKLADILKSHDYDIVHLESLFMTPYLATVRRYSTAPVVLRSHNLEYIIWERVASGTRNLAKRAYLKYLSKKLKDYEMSILNDVDAIAAISENDRKRYLRLGCTLPLITIPFGIDLQNYTAKHKVKAETTPTLFHIGAMDWLPNLEAMLWFVTEVWPLVLKSVPKAELHLAGKGLTADTLPETQNVIVHGDVESAEEFRNAHDLMVVPLLSAGGIRVKIIEAMANGKAVVTTRTGAEGIDGINGVHFMIADEEEDFARAIVQLLNDPEAIVTMGKQARKLCEENFDNRQITAKLIDFYHQLKDEN